MRISLAIAAAVLLASPSVHAYCRTTTVAPPVDLVGSACWNQGSVLYHASACLPYRLLSRESPIIPNAVLSEKLARAFATWSTPNAFCSPGITGIELAPSNETTIVAYDKEQTNDNLVGVVPEWAYEGTVNTLALTTLTFNADSGEIYDVDLEINGMQKWSFAETPPSDAYDLQSTLTHEAGHMLGLAHSPVVQSTMFSNYNVGSTEMRSLHPDDEEGICAIYPNRVQRATSVGVIPARSCELAPGVPAGPACGEPEILHGCGATPSRRGDAGLLGLVVGLFAVIRRRPSAPVGTIKVVTSSGARQPRDRSARGNEPRRDLARPHP